MCYNLVAIDLEETVFTVDASDFGSGIRPLLSNPAKSGSGQIFSRISGFGRIPFLPIKALVHCTDVELNV